MFTSELATMFSSGLANMFMSELETWKNMTCTKNATLHLVIDTWMDESKRRTSFTLFAVNVLQYFFTTFLHSKKMAVFNAEVF